ncbi:sigma-70 family RNA polymerase sigma factor [Caldalkalibacillus salinus]|uniref:sigma-70 family RNA polymerase sigma factor n=1 Tax=Caldalkalibacillus salinus TaxID=2803787 RepID=UPI0019236AAE
MRGSKGGKLICEYQSIQSILAGDKQAYQAFIQRYQKRVYYAIFNIVKDREEAKDLTQEAFLSAYRSLEHFKQGASFSTWVTRIAINKALDYKRKKQPTPVSYVHDIVDEAKDNPNPDPLVALLDQESKSTIHQYLKKLPDVYRQAIYAYYFEQKSYQEIALHEGVETKTIESRLYRARQKLKVMWKEEVKS